MIKLLPALSEEAVRRARNQAAQRFSLWNAAGLIDRRGGVEEDGIPDAELRAVLEALARRGKPVVLSFAVWCSISLLSSAPNMKA